MTIGEKIRFFFRMPAEEKLWVVVFALGSLFMLPLFRVLPAKYVLSRIGNHQSNTLLSSVASREQLQTAYRMGQRMQNVANTVPWPCECLSQCVCLMWMMQRRQIPAVMYLGAKFSENSHDLVAHAWISVGPLFVCGGDGSLHYQVTSTFTSLID